MIQGATGNGESNCIEGQDMPVPLFSSICVFCTRIEAGMSSRAAHAQRHPLVTTVRLDFFRELLKKRRPQSRVSNRFQYSPKFGAALQTVYSFGHSRSVVYVANSRSFRGYGNLENVTNVRSGDL